MCGTKCGAALRPAGSVLQVPVRPHPALTGGLPPPGPDSGAHRRRFFWGGCLLYTSPSPRD
eukprot:1995575-Alexandrium_andersonii.AAC.1